MIDMTARDLQKFSDIVIRLREAQATQADTIRDTLELLDQLAQVYMEMARYTGEFKEEGNG